MKEVTESRESLIEVLNDAYKKASKIHNKANRAWDTIEIDMADVDNLAAAGGAAAKILQLSLDATDKILKVAQLLKDVVLVDTPGTGDKDMNDLMNQAIKELEEEGSYT